MHTLFLLQIFFTFLGFLSVPLFLNPLGLGDFVLAQGQRENTSWLVRVVPGTSIPGARRVIGDWWQVDGGEYSVLALRPNVVDVRPNRTFKLDDPAPIYAGPLNAQVHEYPDDPYYPIQWHLPQVQANDAWTINHGISVTVAVLDTGVTRGKDLVCHTFAAPYNAVTDEEGEEAARDDIGHGTHVAGTIAQCTDNGLGVAGMAPDVALMPVKVLVDGVGSEADLARGILWAVEHGADVINLSLGADCEEDDVWPECGSEVADEAIKRAAEAGAIIVAAAGNSGKKTLVYPANHPDVIAVTAVNYNANLAFYSNYRYGVTLAAPGGDNMDQNLDGYPDGILQETFSGDYGWGYYFMIGTSMATPHVTGAVALLRSFAPHAMPELILQALTQTARDLGDGGYDPRYGYGLIQTADALNFLQMGETWKNKTFLPNLFTDYAQQDAHLAD